MFLLRASLLDEEVFLSVACPRFPPTCQPSLWQGNCRLSNGPVDHISHMEVSACACAAWPCTLQMTEVFERSVVLGPPSSCATVIMPLLPGTRPPTRHWKLHLPRGRASPRPIHPGPPPLGQSTLLIAFDAREHPIAKHQLEESP